MGHQSASTVVGALSARSAVGLKSASTVVSALSARSAVGLKSASTVVGALGARSGGGAFCEHGRQRILQGVRWVSNLRAAACVQGVVGLKSARSCTLYMQGVRCGASTVGHQSASTVVSALSARSAVVGLKSASTVVSADRCKECGGSQICGHGRRRSTCKECKKM